MAESARWMSAIFSHDIFDLAAAGGMVVDGFDNWRSDYRQRLIMQARSLHPADFSLITERLGPLPLVNHFLERMGLPALLEKDVPNGDKRCRVPHAQALGVLIRSIVVEREPIYRA